MNKKVIFILGASYSGTTMLDYMLGNNEHGFSCGEVYALFRPFREHHKMPDCTCGNPTCGRYDVWMQWPEQNLYDNIFMQDSNLDYLVDSSKNVPWIQAQGSYHDTDTFKYVMIYKSPQSWMRSVNSRGENLTLDSYAQVYNSYLNNFKNIIAVNIDNLLNNPGEVLRKLCAELDIPYTPGQEKFWTKQHHAVFGSDSARLHLTARHEPEFGKIEHRIRATKPGKEPVEITRHRVLYKSPNKVTSIKTEGLPSNVAAVVNKLWALDITKGI